MTEVALDCGYPASALKERIYVPHITSGDPVRVGLLIYTATAGTQGTLGGLVEITRRASPGYSMGRWNGYGYVRAIQCVLITILVPRTKIAHSMARPVTAACWWRRQAVRLGICIWTARSWWIPSDSLALGTSAK
jgi:hypothetical protein